MTELEQLFWLVAVSAASVITVLVWTAVLLEACASIAACTRGSPARSMSGWQPLRCDCAAIMKKAGHYEQNDSGLPPDRGCAWLGNVSPTTPARRSICLPCSRSAASRRCSVRCCRWRRRNRPRCSTPGSSRRRRTWSARAPRTGQRFGAAGTPVLLLVALLALAGDHGVGRGGTVPVRVDVPADGLPVGGRLYLWDSRTECAHSRGGIERLRIVESADLEMARIDGELELRRMALEAYINLYKESNRE